MDLTNGEPQHHQQPQRLPVHTVVHVPPPTMTEGSSSEVLLPDVVPDSTRSSAPRGPIHGQQCAAVKVELPDLIEDETDHAHHGASLPDFVYESERPERQDLEFKVNRLKNRSISTSSDYFSMA